MSVLKKLYGFLILHPKIANSKGNRRHNHINPISKTLKVFVVQTCTEIGMQADTIILHPMTYAATGFNQRRARKGCIQDYLKPKGSLFDGNAT